MQRNDLHRIGILAFAALLVAGGAKAPGQLPLADRQGRASIGAGIDHRHPGAAHRRPAQPQMGQTDRGRKYRRRQHEHRRRRRLARGARRLHAVRGAARAACARPSADQEPELQPARLGADHAAGQDRQRAFGAQQPAGEHAPGADRLRQGQSGQAHLRDAGAAVDRASVGRRCSRRWRESRCWRCPIAARSRR